MTEQNQHNKSTAISFRELVTSIPSTTYASHGMYYYPARFIPQVVRWAIEKYTNPGDSVLDPFAGSGTVGVEAMITGRDATCVDLSPMLQYLIDGKTYLNPSLQELLRLGEDIVNSNIEYIPKWTKMDYWYPDEIYSILRKMWGGYYQNPNPIILLALLKTSKKFSYGDDQVPKLFKSKKKVEIISDILQKDYKNAIFSFFLKTVEENYNYSLGFSRYYKGGKLNIVADTDMVDYDLKGEYDMLLTSPPYGQAHEYIRSVKLELGWLGYDDTKIKELGKHEIPYNKNVPDITINSETLKIYLEQIKGGIKNYAITYFRSILYILDKCMLRLKPGGTAAIFVGNATFSGIEFPFHQIFREHFESRGYIYESLLEDHIVSHKLFIGRKNLSPNGMKTEYLLIMKKGYF